MQGHDAVAVADAIQRFRMRARCGVGLALPGVGAAGGLVIVDVIDIGDHGGHAGHRALATRSRVHSLGFEYGGGGDVRAVGGAVGQPLLAFGVPFDGQPAGGRGVQGRGTFAAERRTAQGRCARNSVDDHMEGRRVALAAGAVVVGFGIVGGCLIDRLVGIVAGTGHVAVVPTDDASGGGCARQRHVHAAVGAERFGLADRRGGGLLVRGDRHGSRAGAFVRVGAGDRVGGVCRGRDDEIIARSEVVVPRVGVRAVSGERHALAGAYRAYGCDGHRWRRVDRRGRLHAGGRTAVGVLCAHPIVCAAVDARCREGAARARLR